MSIVPVTDSNNIFGMNLKFGTVKSNLNLYGSLPYNQVSVSLYIKVTKSTGRILKAPKPLGKGISSYNSLGSFKISKIDFISIVFKKGKISNRNFF